VRKTLQLNALKSSRYDEKWWVYKMQIRQVQTQLQSLFLISGYARCVADEYMWKGVGCMVKWWKFWVCGNTASPPWIMVLKIKNLGGLEMWMSSFTCTKWLSDSWCDCGVLVCLAFQLFCHVCLQIVT